MDLMRDFGFIKEYVKGLGVIGTCRAARLAAMVSAGRWKLSESSQCTAHGWSAERRRSCREGHKAVGPIRLPTAIETRLSEFAASHALYAVYCM